MKIKKTIRTYFRCPNCGHTWLPKKKSPKCCPSCHSAKYESIIEFALLREKLKGTTPKQFPYRKNWGKDAKSVSQKGVGRGY